MLKKIGELALGTAGGPLGSIATAWQNKGLIFAILGWALIGPAWLHGCSYGKSIDAAEDLAAEIEVSDADAKAKEAAAGKRLEDELEIVTSEKEAINEINKAKREGVSDASLRLNCERLRRRGFSLAEVPQCERLDSRGEAATDDGDPNR